MDPVLATSWTTLVEVRRHLLLGGPALAAAREQFMIDQAALALIVYDEAVAMAAGHLSSSSSRSPTQPAADTVTG